MRRQLAYILVLSAYVSCCGRTQMLPTPVPQANEQATFTISAATPTIQHVVSPALLKQKSEGAREFLKSAPVKEFACTIQKGKKKQKVSGREIALAFLDQVTLEDHYATIGICFSYSQETITVLDGDFSIQWLRGKGITHFAFEAQRNNVQLVLLDSKHWMSETQRGEYYFPYTDDFLFMEFVLDGGRFLLSQIRQAQEELCALIVRSRTFPSQQLCEIFHDDMLLNIALIEQMDEDEFGNACPQAETLPPQNRIFQNCAEYSVFKVLAHYARNKHDAFRYAGSRMGAIGHMQFTRKTYLDIAINKYPEAKLMRDFETGARDLKNSIKAAICLLDYELSQMPTKIHQIFRLDYRAGGLYPAVAYNGGKNRAQCVFRQKRSGKQCRATRAAWKETAGYITKHQGIWHIINNLVSLLGQN